ncbi:hypothetical protein J6590_107307, partial [Homalodisca vitripennis]
LQQACKISPGTNTSKYSVQRDSKRLRTKNVRATGKYQKYRKLLKSRQIASEDKKIVEGVTYGAGEFQ